MTHDPIDAYLAELIGEATVFESSGPAVEPPPAPIAAAATAVPAEEAATRPGNDLPAAARADLWTAELLAEMDHDPQFAARPDERWSDSDDSPVPATDIVSQPQVWTELLLEELSSDPQFLAILDDPGTDAGNATAVVDQDLVSQPAAWTQALLDELEDDPLFAGATAAVQQGKDSPAAAIASTDWSDELLREMDTDPLFAAAGSPAPATALAGSDQAPPAPSPPPVAAPATPAQPWMVHAPGAAQEEPRQRPASPPVSRWLRLRCGEQPYALELLKVQEVGLPAPLLSLRGTPAHMLGIMNLRGQVVPVMDLGIFLGGLPAEESPATRIVVLESDGQTLGLRVSSVEDVVSLGNDHIEPPDTVRLCRFSNHLFRGVARLGGPPMILLDADALLG